MTARVAVPPAPIRSRGAGAGAGAGADRDRATPRSRGRARGRIVGDVGLGVFEQTGEVELGYTLALGDRGHGYATGAAGACLAAALAHFDVERIVAVVDAETEASRRVAGRLGMERTGTVEAHGLPQVLFAATRYRLDVTWTPAGTPSGAADYFTASL